MSYVFNLYLYVFIINGETRIQHPRIDPGRPFFVVEKDWLLRRARDDDLPQVPINHNMLGLDMDETFCFPASLNE